MTAPNIMGLVLESKSTLLLMIFLELIDKYRAFLKKPPAYFYTPTQVP